MVEIVEVNDIEELAQYRMLWNSLFPGTPNATFFHTFDWLDTYWRHFGHDQKLRVLIVYAAGEPLGILPLCVRTETYRLSKVRVLTYPLDNWSTWYGPIGPNPASTMLAAMQHLRRTPRDWDMMELRWVADENTQGGKSARAMRIAGMFSEKQEYQWTSLVDIPASWDEYLASKSPSLRRQFRRTIRDFFADGRGEYIRHRPLPAAEGRRRPAMGLVRQVRNGRTRELAVARCEWQYDYDRSRSRILPRVACRGGPLGNARYERAHCRWPAVCVSVRLSLPGQRHRTANRLRRVARQRDRLGADAPSDPGQLQPRRPHHRPRPRRTRTQTPAANADGIDISAYVHAD